MGENYMPMELTWGDWSPIGRFLVSEAQHETGKEGQVRHGLTEPGKAAGTTARPGTRLDLAGRWVDDEPGLAYQ
jgi:hypothetical protein